MKPSRSVFLEVRGLKYHCRCWGDPEHPAVFLLHGWMDVSASFQFLVDALDEPRHVVAPDWRGYGLTDWSGSDSYWFPDYYADLDRVLAHFQPEGPVDLVGHSMGGNVASMYAGIRTERVRRLVNMEGFRVAPTRAEDAPQRYARWLTEIEKGARFRDYASFEELAARLCGKNPRLTRERALFLAGHWGRQTPGGRVELRADPAHKLVNPVLYRVEEAMACWKKVSAPVLWMAGAESKSGNALKLTEDDLDQRKKCFPDIAVEVIGDSGHMMHHDQPEQVAQSIERFLKIRPA